MAVSLIALVGCQLTVVPPLHPPSPTVVHLSDYGRHGGLLLPEQEGGWIEYAYGEHDWFALERTSWWRAFPVLLWPTRGTLGRRFLPDERRDELERLSGAVSLVPLTVSGEAAALLRERLASEYTAGAKEGGVAARGMTFVPHPERYWCLHQCNCALAGWLRELGCDVYGVALFSDFRVAARAAGGP